MRLSDLKLSDIEPGDFDAVTLRDRAAKKR